MKQAEEPSYPIRGRLGLRRAAVFVWAVLIALVASGPVSGQQPDRAFEAPSQEHLDRLERYRARLEERDAPSGDLRNWAELLIEEMLSSGSEPSVILVTSLLDAANTPGAARAICEAIPSAAKGRRDRLPVALVDPLVRLLASEDESLWLAAAGALSRFAGDEVPARLAALAASPEANLRERTGAVDALAANVHHREVVAELIRLLDVEEKDVRDAVVTALASAARQPIGSDPQRWRAWWEEKSRLSNEVWLADRLDMYRDRLAVVERALRDAQGESTAQRQALASRLANFQREVYRGAAGEQRDARLVEWLRDEQREVRLTALAIIKSRIADEGRRPEGAILATLLELLAHGTAEVRRESLSIVQNLGDPTIPPAVLKQLSRETDPVNSRALILALGKLGVVEAIPILIERMERADAPLEDVRVAALAIGQIARQLPSDDERSRAAVEPLRRRYEALAGEDAALRSALLTAMAGVGDAAFTSYFVAAVEMSEPVVVRPAIEGLRAVGDRSRLSRLRRLTSAADPLVRIAAIEAVAALGGENADFECLAGRINPSAEPNDLAREAAWRGFRELVRNRPIRNRIDAAQFLTEVPARELAYLTELADSLSSTNGSTPELEQLWLLLGQRLMEHGDASSAIRHLQSLWLARSGRNDPTAVEAGIRLLDAMLQATAYAGCPDLIATLLQSAPDGASIRPRVMETLHQHIESPLFAADPERARNLLDHLHAVTPQPQGEDWNDLVDRLLTRCQEPRNPNEAPNPGSLPPPGTDSG